MTSGAGSDRLALRVLTANLLHEHIDTAAFRHILDEVAPDVVAIQELGPGAAEEIEDRYTSHLLAPEENSRGMGLATRYPADLELVELGGIPALAARLDPELWPAITREVHLVNIHLANPVDWPQWEMAGLRGRQVRKLRDHVAASPNVVVVGDCNATPLWPAYRRLREFLDDGVAAVAARGEGRRRRTWGPFPGGPKLLRIDHVFVRRVGVRAVQRIDLPGSDHAGLVADLTV